MEDDKTFLKGFNMGYYLAEHNPALSQKLKQGLLCTNSALAQGFLGGTQELRKEKFLNKMKNKSQSNSKEIDDNGFEM